MWDGRAVVKKKAVGSFESEAAALLSGAAAAECGVGQRSQHYFSGGWQIGGQSKWTIASFVPGGSGNCPS